MNENKIKNDNQTVKCPFQNKECMKNNCKFYGWEHTDIGSVNDCMVYLFMKKILE